MFTLLSKNLGDTVGAPLYDYCVQRYGKNGLKIESGIVSALSWSPTIQLKKGTHELLAVEVCEDLFPQVLKLVYSDITHDCKDIPITVYVGCPLDAFLDDKTQSTVKKLKERGIGLLTVAQDGTVTEQFSTIPLIHHIPDADISTLVKPLPSAIKVKLRDSFDVYRQNSYQGLQEAGQIIEGLIFSLAIQANKKGWIAAKPEKDAAATILDLMYQSNETSLQHNRAALGRARSFMKQYRNMVSHAPKSLKAAAERYRLCHMGFREACGTALDLVQTHKNVGFVTRLYFP